MERVAESVQKKWFSMFPAQSADLTSKRIKHNKPKLALMYTNLIFTVSINNVPFLFYLHSLIWIRTHFVQICFLQRYFKTTKTHHVWKNIVNCPDNLPKRNRGQIVYESSRKRFVPCYSTFVTISYRKPSQILIFYSCQSKTSFSQTRRVWD
jgi:hypothetical protein